MPRSACSGRVGVFRYVGMTTDLRMMFREPAKCFCEWQLCEFSDGRES